MCTNAKPTQKSRMRFQYLVQLHLLPPSLPCSPKSDIGRPPVSLGSDTHPDYWSQPVLAPPATLTRQVLGCAGVHLCNDGGSGNGSRRLDPSKQDRSEFVPFLTFLLHSFPHKLSGTTPQINHSTLSSSESTPPKAQLRQWDYVPSHSCPLGQPLK